MTDLQPFGEFIRKTRLDRGIGLREAAILLGVSASYLSRIETGNDRPPSGGKLNDLARIYNIDIDELWIRAKNRVQESIASDSDTAPIAAVFYRLAKGLAAEQQEAMIWAAINSLEKTENEKKELFAQIKNSISNMKKEELQRQANPESSLFTFDIKPRVLSKKDIDAIANAIVEEYDEESSWAVDVASLAEIVDSDVRLVVEEDTRGGQLRDGSPAVLGMSRWSECGQYRELVVHEDLFDKGDRADLYRGRFTIAHELFHCLEHLPLVDSEMPQVSLNRAVFDVSRNNKWYGRKKSAKKLVSHEDWREWQANYFASCLLMPANRVMNAFIEAFDGESIKTEDESVEELADRLARKSVSLGGRIGIRFCDYFEVNPQPMAIRLIALKLVD